MLDECEDARFIVNSDGERALRSPSYCEIATKGGVTRSVLVRGGRPDFGGDWTAGALREETSRFEKGPPTMPSDHKIKARDIINDLRSGMTDTELMEKYEMSASALQMAFEQLINMKLLKDHELYGRSVNTRETFRLPRHYLVVKVPIRDVKSGVVGTIRDITEKNMGIVGIGGTLGEIRTFEISPEGFEQVRPFLFNGKCRWTKRDEQGGHLSGYEITSISEESLEQLRKLIQLVTLE